MQWILIKQMNIFVYFGVGRQRSYVRNFMSLQGCNSVTVSVLWHREGHGTRSDNEDGWLTHNSYSLYERKPAASLASQQEHIRGRRNLHTLHSALWHVQTTEAVLVCSLFYPDPRREWGESGKQWCSAPVSCAHLLYLLKSVKGDSGGGADSEVSSWVEPESMTSS